MEVLLIRADAGPEIGAGHVMRCLALVQEWHDQAGHAVFAMAECAPAIRARVEAEGCDVVDVPAPVGSNEDGEWLSQYAKLNPPSWIVLDGYRFGANYHQLVREGPWQLLCVDDEGKCSEYGADLILNQNLAASPAMYGKSGRSRLLLGCRYTLLRKEFRSWQGRRRSIPPTAKSVLVTLGGSTPKEVALAVLRALDLAKIRDLDVTFVIGGAGLEVDEITESAAGALPGVRTVRNPSHMPELMASADLAISAAGATCWELCFMGVPSLLIDIAPNQTPNAQALGRGGYAVHAGAASSLSVEGLAGQLRELLMSQQRRQHFSERCTNLVDGRGATRVVEVMRSGRNAFRLAENDADLVVRE